MHLKFIGATLAKHLLKYFFPVMLNLGVAQSGFSRPLPTALALPARVKPKLLISRVLLLSITAATALSGCAGGPASGTQQPGTGGIPMMGGGRDWMRGPGMRGRGGGMMAPGMRGCGGMMMGGSMQRHRLAMMEGMPAAYRGLSNPLPSNSLVISEGKALFQSHCTSCHGEIGEGDGPAAAGLSPPPANLRWMMRRPMAGGGYLMWTISEGGGQLGTAMPAFKDALNETERWKIIRFLRTL